MADGIFILGLVIVVGFLGHLLFRKTQVPESVFLMIMGILLGPVFHLVSPQFFLDNAPFFVSLAMIIVLLESGLTLNLSQTIKNTPHAFFLSVLVLIFTTILVSLLMVLVF